LSSSDRHFPYPLPDGWFRVGFADESPPGTVRPLRYFGQDLVLMVSDAGVAQVFDAHCPHLGAHLGFGGSVDQESLRCPFHGWRFGLDGRCLEIAYAKRIPSQARLRAWPTCSRAGAIWVWHHREGRSPDWEVPEIAEASDASWTPWLHQHWQVRTRNQEIAENTSDPAHFHCVHGFPQIPTPEISFEGHRSRSLSHYDSPKASGETVPSTLEVCWHGLGIGVTRVTGALELLFLGTLTPVDDEVVDACFSFSVCSARGFSAESGAGRASIAESIRQMEQDIPIWENKAFRQRPLLCDGDGPIGHFRRWAAQFYSGPDSVKPRPSRS
jgi:3-ketosteroid 9alpha-monooxygenase subunit A